MSDELLALLHSLPRRGWIALSINSAVTQQEFNALSLELRNLGNAWSSTEDRNLVSFQLTSDLGTGETTILVDFDEETIFETDLERHVLCAIRQALHPSDGTLLDWIFGWRWHHPMQYAVLAGGSILSARKLPPFRPIITVTERSWEQ